MLDVFMITTGSMIAAGLFVLPGIAFARWLSISLKCAYALLGIKFVGMAQVALTSALICVLTYLAVGGIGSINTAYFEPFSPVGFGPVLSTAGFIFISYGGMLAITGPIYTIVVFVIVGNLEASVLINTLTPVADTDRDSPWPSGRFTGQPGGTAGFCYHSQCRHCLCFTLFTGDEP